MLDINQLALFFLVLARLSAFFVAGPLFSLGNIPGLVKIGLSFTMAVVIYPTMATGTELYPADGWQYIFALVREVMVGLALGYTATLVLNALIYAGSLIDMQIGFFMSLIFDPLAGATAGIVSRFLHLMGLAVLLAVDGHHMIISALSRSFSVVPVNTAQVSGDVAIFLIKVFAQVITLGVQIAAPLMAVMLVVDVTLGLLARTAPQINVFMLGFPIKIIFGMVTLGVMVPVLVRVIYSLCTVIERNMGILLKGII